MKVVLLTVCAFYNIGRTVSFHQSARNIRLSSNALFSGPPGMMPMNEGPGVGVGVNDVPPGMPQDLPQGVGPLPGTPMVPYGPNGPQSSSQSYGGGFGNGYDDDRWYENPSNNWNNQNGWNNQGDSSKWWQNGVRNSDNVLQGNSRKTWSSSEPWNMRSSHVHLQSERPYSPLTATVDYLQGPGNTARKMRVYSEDGYARPLRANFANTQGGSRGYSNTIDVKNNGPMEFPMSAGVTQTPQPMMRNGGEGMMMNGGAIMGGMMGGMMGAGPDHDWVHGRGGMAGGGFKNMKTVQGGSLKTYTFDPQVNYVQIDIETDGMPCYAKVEVSQGPGDARQVFDVYSDDGAPWQGIVETPGYGSTILVKNEGPMEYPIKCSLEPIG